MDDQKVDREGGGSVIGEQQAIELATVFVAHRGPACGPITEVMHHNDPPTKNFVGRIQSPGKSYYRVEFAYSGPPISAAVIAATDPPPDHPTVVFVNDQTGECRLLYWL
jgi:hypothetical protein